MPPGADAQSLGLFQWAVQIGGPMAALLLIFGYFYRKDMKEAALRAENTQKANTDQYREDMKFYTDALKAVIEDWRGHSGHLVVIVKENTSAFTKNTQVIESLHAHIVEGAPRLQDRRGLTP